MSSRTIRQLVSILALVAIALIVAYVAYRLLTSLPTTTRAPAETAFEREYASHPAIVALALASRCRTGEYAQAERMIREIGTPVTNPVVNHAIAHCEQDFTFARAERFVRTGHAAGAIRLMSPWYPHGPDPYRAGLILMRAEILQHHLRRAMAMGSALAARYPADTSLPPLVRALKSRIELDRAQVALQSGRFSEAIRRAAPVYRSGPDVYRAGLILAHAELAEHHFQRAQAIYTSLARRYPKDRNLALQQGRMQTATALAEARHALIRHEPRRAIRIIRTHYPTGEIPPEGQRILAQAYAGENRIGQASRIYQGLLKNHPSGHLGYRKMVHNLGFERLLQKARGALLAHHPERAIRIVRPLYESGQDPYDSGRLLAAAELMRHHDIRAEHIDERLARLYPKDPRLAEAARNIRVHLTLVRARGALLAHHPERAIRIVRPLYESGQDPYDSGHLLAAAELMRHHDVRAERIDERLARRYPKDPGLAETTRNLRIHLTLVRARGALLAHQPERAIRIVRPLYESGQDPYDSGLILVQAYSQLHERKRAARIYTELARRYPHAAGLRVASVVAEVQAGHARTARSEMAELNPSETEQVYSSLGPGLTRLYPRFITVDGSIANSTAPYPPDNQFGISGGFPLGGGIFVGSVQRYHRFGETAESLGAAYYTAFGHGTSGAFSVGYSPNNTILAHESFGVAVSQAMGPVSLDLSVRHLIFSDTVANILFGGVGFYPARNLHLETGIYYVPETQAYSILVAPEWFHGGLNRTYLYLTAGQAGEQLVVQNAILRTRSYGATLGEVFELTNHLALNVALFYEYRAGLYDRRGLFLSLTRRW